MTQTPVQAQVPERTVVSGVSFDADHFASENSGRYGVIVLTGSDLVPETLKLISLEYFDAPKKWLNEDTSSAHWEEITLTSNAPLFCCALVHIEGYEPITCWYGAYLSLDDFYIDLRLADFVLREPDVVSFSI
jgi:hypothetical protein